MTKISWLFIVGGIIEKVKVKLGYYNRKKIKCYSDNVKKKKHLFWEKNIKETF